MDVYFDGCQMTKQYCDFDAEKAFIERLMEKVENDRKLRKVMKKITKNYDDDVKWLNNLVVLHNCLDKKITDEANELLIWQDIMVEELSRPNQIYEINFSNKEDVYEDIHEFQSNAEIYNKETKDHLSEELEAILGIHLPKNKSEAVEASQFLNKETLKYHVQTFLNYVDWHLENVYKFIIQYSKALANNIQIKMTVVNDEDELYPISKSLIQPVPVPYQLPLSQNLEEATQNDMEVTPTDLEVEDIVCKGCDEEFKSNTILKHLNHPAVDCKNDYSSSEIKRIQKNSCIRHQIQNKYWMQRYREDFPTHYKKQIEKHSIKRKVKIAIDKVTDWYGPSYIQSRSHFRKKLSKVKKGLKEKVLYERNERLKIWNEDLFYGTHYSYIHDWEMKIKKEIMETYNHLIDEIDTTINRYIADPKDRPANSYLNHTSYVIFQDSIIFYSKDNEYRIFKSSIQKDMKSLEHYIQWRLENSLEYIIERTVNLADTIKEEMTDGRFFNYMTIKRLERLNEPQKYNMLEQDDSNGKEMSINEIKDWKGVSRFGCYPDYTEPQHMVELRAKESKLLKQYERGAIISICNDRHEFQCLYGQQFGFVHLEKIQTSDHVENCIIQKYLKKYNEETEDIIKTVKDIVQGDGYFKNIVEDLKIEMIITMNKLEEIFNSTIEKGMTKYILKRLTLFQERLLGSFGLFNFCHQKLGLSYDDQYGMKKTIINTLKMKDINLFDMKSKSDSQLLIEERLLQKAFYEILDGPYYKEKYSWNVLNLNIFLQREMVLAMQLIEIVREKENNDSLYEFENQLKHQKSHFQDKINKFDETAKRNSQNTTLRIEMYNKFKTRRNEIFGLYRLDESNASYLQYKKNFITTVELIKDREKKKARKYLKDCFTSWSSPTQNFIGFQQSGLRYEEEEYSPPIFKCKICKDPKFERLIEEKVESPKGVFAKYNYCRCSKILEIIKNQRVFIPQGLIDGCNMLIDRAFEEIDDEPSFVSWNFLIDDLHLVLQNACWNFHEIFVYHQKSLLYTVEEAKYLELHKAKQYIKLEIYLFKSCMEKWRKKRVEISSSTTLDIIPLNFISENEVENFTDECLEEIFDQLEELKEETEFSVVNLKIDCLKVILEQMFNLLCHELYTGGVE